MSAHPNLVDGLGAKATRIADAIAADQQRIDDSAARIAGIEAAGRLGDIEQRIRRSVAAIHAAYCEAVRRADGEAADSAVLDLRRLAMDTADELAGERIRLSRDHAARVRALASRV